MSKLDTSLVFFHGEMGQFRGFPSFKPSVLRPMYATPSYEEARSYGYYIYPIFIRQNQRIFDLTNENDVLKLKGGRTYFSDDTIDLLADEYSGSDGQPFNLWLATHSPKITFTAFVMLMDSIQAFLQESNSVKGQALEKLLNDLKAYRYFLTEPIHHDDVEDAPNPKNSNFAGLCKNIFANIRIDKDKASSMILNRGEYERSSKLLVAMMMADTMQAVVEGKYPYNFLTYRRIIYQAILDLGFSTIHDTNTNGNNGDELIIISQDGLERIMNKPLHEKLMATHTELREILNICDETGSIDRQTFQNIIAKIKGR